MATQTIKRGFVGRYEAAYQVKMQGFSLAISILWVLLSWSPNIIFIKIFLDWTLLASYQFPMQFLICLVNYHLPLPPPLTSLPSYPSFPYFPSILPLLPLLPFHLPPPSLTSLPSSPSFPYLPSIFPLIPSPTVRLNYGCASLTRSKPIQSP